MKLEKRITRLEGRSPIHDEAYYEERRLQLESATQHIEDFVAKCQLPPMPNASLAERFAAAMGMSISGLKSEFQHKANRCTA